MVSAVTVTGDKKAVTRSLDKSQTCIEDIGMFWEGASYNNLKEKFYDFFQETQCIETTMSSFVNAIKYYEKYIKEKRKSEEKEAEYRDYKSKYDNCADDDSNKSHYWYKRNSAKEEWDAAELEMQRYKKLIEEELSSIIGAKGISAVVGKGMNAFGNIGDTIKDTLGIGSLIRVNGNLVLDCNADGVVDKFGGQADDIGPLGYIDGGCDNYARAYSLYIQTGEVSNNSVLTSGCGLQYSVQDFDNRHDQARCAFERVQSGKPCVIHVNSGTGNGHWMTVIGYKEGTTAENVEIGDLIVIDSAGNWGSSNSAKVRACSEDSNYCREGIDPTMAKPKGMQVVMYD